MNAVVQQLEALRQRLQRETSEAINKAIGQALANLAPVEPVTRQEPEAKPATEGLLSNAQVRQLTNLSRTTLWKLERDGRFPQRVRISANRVGWRASDIAAFVQGGTTHEPRTASQPT